MGTSAFAQSGLTINAVYGRLIRTFRSSALPRFGRNDAEYKALFFLHEKQGLAKVNHCISHKAGIVLKFNTKQIAHPLFASQDTSLKIPSAKKQISIWYLSFGLLLSYKTF